MLPTTSHGSGELVQALEQIEIDATRDLYTAGASGPAEACGLQAVDFGGALGVMAPRFDVLALNRVIGLGVATPADASVIDAIMEWYAVAGVPRMFVQVCPAARPEALTQWLTGRGFRPYNHWVRLYRGAEPPPDVPTDLRVERVGREHAADFGRINAICFGWPESVSAWVGEMVGRPGWHHYMAFDGGTPVATGCLYVAQEVAWFSFASTLPEYRGRGAQGALLARRIRDAVALGCTLMSVETAQPTGQRDAPSYRNVQRMGFREAYLRANYIFTPEPPT